METHIILKLIFIGLLTGVVASVVGGGAELLMIPLLVMLGVCVDYKEAVGTSLCSLLLPIGLYVVYVYNEAGKVRWCEGLLLSLLIVLGSVSSKYTVGVDVMLYKKLYGALTIMLGVGLLLL